METSTLSIAAIRALGIDTINKANSGHPGMVLGSAPAIYTLFTKEMNFYHKQSKWFNRDRFVLASDMHQRYYIQCYIYLDIRFQWMI